MSLISLTIKQNLTRPPKNAWLSLLLALLSLVLKGAPPLSVCFGNSFNKWATSEKKRRRGPGKPPSINAEGFRIPLGLCRPLSKRSVFSHTQTLRVLPIRRVNSFLEMPRTIDYKGVFHEMPTLLSGRKDRAQQIKFGFNLNQFISTNGKMINNDD